MIRLFVLVEGETEEQFVTAVLRPHLAGRGVQAIPIIVTTRRDRRTGRKIGRGGGHWKHWRKDLRRLAAEHSGTGVHFTTLFDLYGLPRDFPELDRHRNERDTVRRAELLEAAMAQEIGDRRERLIPYLQRHEFEALVLAGLDVLEDLLDEGDVGGLSALRAAIGDASPEDVDDGKTTAPSKRLQAAMPNYQKTVHGPLAVEGTGMAALRRACPRFDAWVTRLEQLAGD